MKITLPNNRDMAALFLMLIAMSFWFFADVFGHELLAQIAILAILAMSLDLLVGYTGMVSLGHAAFFGLGGYVSGILAIHAFNSELLISWPYLFNGSNNSLIIWFLINSFNADFFIIIRVFYYKYIKMI